MTADMCATFALAGGYKYFGLEYGKEMVHESNKYEDSLLKRSDTFNPLSMPSQACNMRCRGDATQSCGGSWLLNMYSAAPMFVLPPGLFLSLLSIMST